MNKCPHLWLVRFYALLILIVALSGIFEGTAFKLILSIASIAIILQSFWI